MAEAGLDAIFVFPGANVSDLNVLCARQSQ